MRFMARASEHGFSVSKPWGDSEAYDFIVAHQGRLRRVQVKSTTFRRKNCYICQLRGRNKPAYTSQEVDFVAVYVIPKNVWFIFPIDVVLSGRDLTLSPHLEVSKNAAYEEAWHLMLGGNVSRATINPSADVGAPVKQG